MTPTSAGEGAWSDSELLIKALWEELLGRQITDRQQSFFSCGGDSILSVQFVAAARRAGLKLTLRDILTTDTIEHLAAEADRRANYGTAADPSEDALLRLLEP